MLCSSNAVEEIPDFLHICHKSDPNLSQCVVNSVNTLKPLLATGIPEYDIIPLEPLELGDLLVAGSKTGQGLSISAKGVKVYGSGNFEMKNFKVIEYASKYNFQIGLPHLYVHGKYVVDGRVLFLPITGEGNFTANFTQGQGEIRLRGVHKEINGETHFVVNKLDIKITVQKGKIELENLFGGDKALGDIINTVINENFETFTQDLIPLIEKSLSRIFKQTGNKIFKRFTLAQLFPQ
ncbi:hypothetical protein PVAND_002206 [Polypedilum vanderplanki]|uniref:Protein takeout n=1 Tax=Polypedilum vanderplanki TaxID=319348 RepID=A0A9J6BQA3_POLVA|nr:hypothetical protein PVAND_002206 [Polypedilum vanderplanki]